MPVRAVPMLFLSLLVALNASTVYGQAVATEGLKKMRKKLLEWETTDTIPAELIF